MRQRVKVLLLDLGREMRGGQRQVYYLARHLAASERFEPLAACPAGAPLAAALDTLRVPVEALPGSREWDPRNLVRLLGLLRRENPAILHTNDARSASLGALLKLLRPGFKLVHSRRVSYALGRGWSRMKYRLADRVAAVSGETGEVLAWAGVDPRRIRVVHSGIDPALYKPRNPKGPGLPLTLVAVGALTPQKGHECLLRGLALLQERPGLPDWRLRVIGEGPLRPRLEELVRELGLAGRVGLEGWADSRSVLPDADILVLASAHGEGSSAAIKEAWAVGLPVLCSDLPSNLELVEPGQSGLAFARQDPGALSWALEQLLLDPARREALAAGGRARLARFTDQAMAQGMMALYAELLEAGRS